MKIWMPAIRTGSGSDIFTERLSQELIIRGHKVVVTWFPHLCEIFPFPLKFIDPPPGTDIVHTNSWSAFAFKRKGIPLVVSMHHSVHDRKYKPYRSIAQAIYHNLFIYFYEKSGVRVASKVVASSGYTAKIITSLFGDSRVVSVPIGIDTEFFCPCRRADARPGGKYQLLFVGNTSRRKGIDCLVGIMRELGPKYMLSYTGPENAALKNLGHTVCLGRLDDRALVAAYQNCDAFVFPSRYEGFGQAVAEAMACGRPVVVSDNSALSELIVDRVSGILCPTDDVEAFVKAITEICNNESLAESISRKARESVQTRNSVGKMIDTYIDIYQSLLNEEHSARF